MDSHLEEPDAILQAHAALLCERIQGGWRKPDLARLWGDSEEKLCDEGLASAIGHSDPYETHSDLCLIKTSDLKRALQRAISDMQESFEPWTQFGERPGVGMVAAWFGPEDGFSMIAQFLVGDEFMVDNPVQKLSKDFECIELCHCEEENSPTDAICELASFQASPSSKHALPEIAMAAAMLASWIEPDPITYFGRAGKEEVDLIEMGKALLEAKEISKSAKQGRSDSRKLGL